MSLFDNPEYRWRETYLLFHKRARRLSVSELRQAISGLQQTFELQDVKSDEADLLESATILAPDAFAAIDIGYIAEDDIRDQAETIRSDMKDVIEDPEELAKLGRLPEVDARLDLLHFEKLADFSDDDDEFSAFFDPGALLSVIETLSTQSDGVCVDPASSTVM